MKFHFTKELTIMNSYANIEVPVEELEKYFWEEEKDRDEDSITDAAVDWFNQNWLELEPTDNEVIDTTGGTTVELQETKDRKHAEAVERWKQEDAARQSMAK
jgi:hypothetical protein